MVDLNFIQTIFELLYQPSYIADGNYKLQHLAMRQPEDDVFLRDGKGYMLGWEPYRTHIKTTTEHFQGSFKFNIYFCTWEHFQLILAISKFHLGAHIKECFYKFLLNSILRTSQIDGEIMERLWSILDKVLRITQSMTWAHHQEMLDNHIEDRNFKKLVRSGK